MDQQYREQQAEQEAAHTSFSRGVAGALFALFLMIVVAVPVVDTLRNPGPIQGGMHLLPARFEIDRSLSEEGLIAGGMTLNRRLHQNMEQFEGNLEQGTFLRDWFIGPVNRAVTRKLGGRNADVCAGRYGWLFYGPAVDHLTGPPFQSVYPAGKDPVTVLRNFHQDLADRGIALVVMPIPVKASIYPERLSTRVTGDTPILNPSHQALVEELESQGVLVCDPTSVLMEAKQSGVAYLAGDSHWTPHGQHAAIAHLAALMREKVPSLSQEPAGYRLAPSTNIANQGDLVDLLEPGAVSDLGEEIALTPVVDRGGEPWKPSEAAPVMLLGDSFASIYQLEGMGWGTGAGMAAQLSYALQLPVDAITQNGDGAFATRLALNQELGRGRDRLAGKQVVVFAFAAREFSVGDWKPDLRLAEMKSADADPIGHGPTTVTGTIVAQSKPPEPGSVPYKDCIVATHLAEVSGGPGIPSSLVVYRWGMRDNQWTEVARQRSGDEVRIIIQPWSPVAPTYGSYNRMELEEEGATALTLWWAPEFKLAEEAEPVARENHSSALADGERIGLGLRIQSLEASGELVHRGVGDWLYFLPELRFLAAGPFWGAAAPAVSRASNPEFADPWPAIQDFHKQLAAHEIELMLVPVPAKATIYGEETGIGQLAGTQNKVMNEFLTLCADAGITVVDLEPEFRALRDTGEPLLYCQQDTHWSPFAIRYAAEALAEHLRERPWYDGLSRGEFPIVPAEIVVHGDLREMLAEPRPDPEVVPVWHVGGDAPPAVDRESPVLLIGDSHNLVFHAGGDMHDTGAGLPDHLAAALGIPVDLVAVRGSGATTPRINLARRRDNLAGKRVVIWCFTAREFTESNTGWRPIPVIH